MPFVRHQTILKKKKPSRDDWATKMPLWAKTSEWAFSGQIIKDNRHSVISFSMLKCWGKLMLRAKHRTGPSNGR